jgi:hypothetical protein
MGSGRSLGRSVSGEQRRDNELLLYQVAPVVVSGGTVDKHPCTGVDSSLMHSIQDSDDRVGIKSNARDYTPILPTLPSLVTCRNHCHRSPPLYPPFALLESHCSSR